MNTYYLGTISVTDELYHHGILGQKWGIRRYQNPDGTLTEEGKKRYGGALGSHNLKRDLNRLEQEYAYSKGDQYKSQKQGDKEAERAAVKRQEEIESQTWQLLAAAHDLNYDVLSTPKMRSTVRRGEQWIADIPAALTIPIAMIAGPTTGYMVGAVTGAIAGGAQRAYDIKRYGGPDKVSAETNKYKVKKNGSGKTSFVGR